MLHRFQSTDHRLDARTDLLILLQQCGTFRRQRILALLQRAILVLQLVANLDERVHALLQSLEFVLEHCSCIIGHGSNIEPPRGRINRDWRQSGNCVASPRIKWDHSALATQEHANLMTETTIDHGILDDALKRCGSSWNAGQTHGLLCGRLSVAGADGATRWFEQVLEDTDPHNALRAECESLLDALCATTWRQLVERQSEFELLLPDDSDTTGSRAAAMAQWCEGFLHGLVSEKHSDALKKRLAAEPLADIVRDMLQITRAATDEDADDEGEENAYAELVEYLRVATQLAYEELAEFRGAGDDTTPEEPDTLH